MLAIEAVQMAAPRTAVFYNGCAGVDNNKRLSILGNAILSKVLCAAWFQARDPTGHTHSAARWTAIRNDLISAEGLSQRGYKVGIDKCIYVAGGMHRKSPKMVGSTLEAVVGAIFLYGGDAAVGRVIEHFGFLEHGFL
ncbi:hypothetical protein CC86DRAFT_330464, partial [Ophiobolus disseminans]